jgi:L-fuconolactonase
MRLDAHQHFWRYSAVTHPWIDASMGALERDFLPADLESLLAAAGFDGCIAVQAQQNVDETEWLLRLADESSFVRGVVGWVDLRDPAVGVQLQRLTAHPKLRGVRHIAQDEADDRFLLRDDFCRGIAALAPHDLTYDVLVYARQLPAAIELVRRFPRQRFVLDHLGKPDIRGGGFAAWRTELARLAALPNATCKLSGLVTEADWRQWKPAELTPYLDVAFASFGAERLMIGSDWPVCLLAGSYADVVGVVGDYVGRLAAAERDAVLGGTAARFYGLAAA